MRNLETIGTSYQFEEELETTRQSFIHNIKVQQDYVDYLNRDNLYPEAAQSTKAIIDLDKQVLEDEDWLKKETVYRLQCEINNILNGICTSTPIQGPFDPTPLSVYAKEIVEALQKIDITTTKEFLSQFPNIESLRIFLYQQYGLECILAREIQNAKQKKENGTMMESEFKELCAKAGFSYDRYQQSITLKYGNHLFNQYQDRLLLHKKGVIPERKQEKKIR